MKISKRLKSLAGLITLDDKVADIGCDHALQDIYMVKNNITEKVLIADVSENALENGIKNVKKYHTYAGTQTYASETFAFLT